MCVHVRAAKHLIVCMHCTSSCICVSMCWLCDIVGVKGGLLELCVSLLNICQMFARCSVFAYALHHWPQPSVSVVVDGSDSEEKPLKGSSLCSLNGDDMVGDGVSRDSLVEYADGGGEFSEDGSFIGEYSGRKQRGSVTEPSEPSPVTA